MTKRANLLQEDVLLENTERLVQSLKPSTDSKTAFNIQPYLQNVAMDIIIRLVCGRDLQAIHSGNIPHPTAVTTDRAFRLSVYYLQFRRLSSLIANPLENLLGKLTLHLGMLDYMDFVTPFIQDRLKSSSTRPDIGQSILSELVLWLTSSFC